MYQKKHKNKYIIENLKIIIRINKHVEITQIVKSKKTKQIKNKGKKTRPSEKMGYKGKRFGNR